MYRTEHGTFSGDSWEDFCQQCFKLKYVDEGYQEMPAWQGDLGIEGFTRTGKVFQCYCPDAEYPPDKLYEEQRDKITKDLNKLETYENELKAYLRDIKITHWIFVTPEYRKKDLVKHCHEKAETFRKKGISILADDFDVFVYNIGFFSAEIPVIRSYQQKKVEIIPNAQASTDDIVNWKTQQIPSVDQAVRKHRLRLPEEVLNVDRRVNQLTEKSVQDLLNGNILIRKWLESYPEDYERFERLKSVVEEQVKELCVFPCDDNNERYKEIEKDLRAKLVETFPHLAPIMIDRLCYNVMADWIFRCPIDFE